MGRNGMKKGHNIEGFSRKIDEFGSSNIFKIDPKGASEGVIAPKILVFFWCFIVNRV